MTRRPEAPELSSGDLIPFGAALPGYNAGMMPRDGDGPEPARFATTRWSLIVAAREVDTPRAREALAELCRTYWFPLYAFIRRQGFAWDQAQDLTQEFFARLLERDGLARADQARGRFRSFLLAACAHFLSNERDRAQALKRGGGRTFLPIDFRVAEERYLCEPAHDLTAEKLFERRWALSLLELVLARLRKEYQDAAKGPLFDALKGYLLHEPGGPGYRDAAEWLGLTEGTVKISVHRLRKRYRELLREEIERTVEDPGEVEEEIRSLFRALG
jgi:RNA polymerase sigma-70 factor (ECF subfamily)